MPPLSLRAVDVSTDDFFEPGSTAADVVILLAEDPAEGVAASEEDAGVMWVRWERPGAYRLAWGEADSPWLFVAEAASPEGLAALVTAFLATAREGAVTSQAPAGTGAASPSPSSRLSWPQQLTANVGALTAGTGYARAVSRAGLSRSS